MIAIVIAQASKHPPTIASGGTRTGSASAASFPGGYLSKQKSAEITDSSNVVATVVLVIPMRKNSGSATTLCVAQPSNGANGIANDRGKSLRPIARPQQLHIASASAAQTRVF
jgi:hypothetical protein